MAIIAGRWSLTEYNRVMTFAQATKTIQPKLGPLKPGSNADDPAIWIHPTDRNRSLMFLSDKGAGIFVYDFSGNQIQHVDFGTTLNNIDVRKGFNYADRTIDILAGNLRGTGKLAVLEIKPDWTQGNAVTILADDASSGNTISSDSYGFTLYRRKSDGAMFVFDKSKNSNPIVQWQITGSSGTISVTKVREFSGIGVAEGADLLYALPGGDDPRDARQLRLRVQPRACRLGRAPVRLQGRDRPVVRRYLPEQQHQERAAHGHAERGRGRGDRSDGGADSRPRWIWTSSGSCSTCRRRSPSTSTWTGQSRTTCSTGSMRSGSPSSARPPSRRSSNATTPNSRSSSSDQSNWRTFGKVVRFRQPVSVITTMSSSRIPPSPG